MLIRLICCSVAGIYLSLSAVCFAQTQSAGSALPANIIVIKNHEFNPPSLIIPAHQKVQITVDNQDPSAEEFESFDLDREQVVEGHQKIIVYLGPLAPGTYGYWADYHKDAKGTIVVQ